MQALYVLGLTLTAVAQGQTPKSKTLISFPGYKWIENNDPIMGGQSHGNWSIVDNSFGRFQGSVKNVSFLHAPGFCRAVTVAVFLDDASEFAAGGMLITARSSTPSYKGFKLSFGTPFAPKHHNGHELEGSFKTPFAVPASQKDEWQTVFIKFDQFSSDWSDFTGECSTKDPDGYQHKCCSKDAADVCPNASRLKGINSFNIWAEGSEGDFSLDVKSIEAVIGKGLVIV